MPSFPRVVLVFSMFTVLTHRQLPAQQAPQLIAPAAPSARGGPMTNADVISLASAGLSGAVIAEKIRATRETAFDTSVEGLKALKAGGASDEVIHAVFTSAGSPAGYSTSDDPALPHQPGVYIQIAGRDGQAHLVMLEHTEAAGSKGSKSGMSSVGSTLAMATGYGAMAGSKIHIKAELNGPKSPVQISDKNPSFYIYTAEDTERFGGSDFSVRDFTLLKFHPTSKTREVEISTTTQYGMGGGDTGIEDKVRQQTIAQKVKPGIYLIKLVKTLKPGEYAFEHLLDGFFYDFGVSEGQ
jgi:hypothetical protein